MTTPPFRHRALIATAVSVIVLSAGVLQWRAERRRAVTDTLVQLQLLADKEAQLIQHWVAGKSVEQDTALRAVTQSRALAESLFQIRVQGIETLSLQHYDRSGSRQAEAFDPGVEHPVLSREELAGIISATGAAVRFRWDAKLSQPVVEVVKASRSAGVVVQRTDPKPILYQMLTVSGAFSPSSEAYLVRAEGDEVVYLNDLRHRSATALRLRMSVRAPRLLGAVLVRGEKPNGNEIDYRGIRVIGAGRAVPGTDWVLVSKVDYAEVVDAVDTRYRFLLLLGAGMVAIVFGVLRHLLLRGNIERLRIQQEAERRHQVLSARFEQLSRHANDCIYVLDGDLRIVDANEKAVRVYGYPREKLIGLSVKQLRAPETVGTVAGTIGEIRRRGGLVFETVHRRADGTTFPVEVSSFGQEGPDGWSYMSIVRDVTERKRMEKEREQFYRFFRTSTDLMCIADPLGAFKTVNPAFMSMLGYSEAELVSKPFVDFIVPEDKQETIDEMARQMQKGFSLNFENRYRCKDGSVRHLSWRAVYDKNDALTYATARDVTEMIAARRKLEQSELRYRELVEQAPIGVAVIESLTGRIVSVNPMFARIAGRTAEEMARVDWMSITHPDDVQKDLDQMARLNAGEISGFKMEKRYLRPEGGVVWISMTIARLKVEASAPPRHLCMIRDITDRVAADEMLSKSSRALRMLSLCNEAVVRAVDEQDLLAKVCESVVRGGGLMMAWVGWRLDDEGKTVRPAAQAGFEKGYLERLAVTWADSERGRGPTGTAIRTGVEAICRDIRTDPRMAPWRAEALARGYVSSISLPLISGAQVLGALTIYSHELEAFGAEEVALLKDLAADLCFGVVSLRARTEMTKAQDALRRSNAYNRGLIEASLDPLVTIGPDGKITDVNRATALVTGRAREELIGSDFSEYFTDPERATAGYMKAFRDGAVRDYDLEIRGRDGSVTGVRYNASVYNDDAGRVIGVFAAARDVTELNRAENKIRKLNAELEERVKARTAAMEAANKELEAFTYSVSHDLRAPLRSMDGFSQILMEDYAPKLEPECRRYLGLVRNSAQVMGQLIDDLLAFSRLGRQGMTKASVSMEEVVRAALEALEPQRASSRAQIKIGALAPCRGDFALLKQVWINLLSNALKFTSKRENAVIEVDSHEEAGETVYRVKDNGVGFDMRYVDKLFKVFQRLHPREQYEGTGVGLAIVARVVERHGGRVWARAELDKGAEFFFTVNGRKQ